MTGRAHDVETTCRFAEKLTGFAEKPENYVENLEKYSAGNVCAVTRQQISAEKPGYPVENI